MGLKNGQASGKSGLLAAATPLAMLTCVAILAFANAWPDNLVLDDKAFAGPARVPELDSLHYIFTHEVWATVGTQSGLYRPLLLLQLSLETRVIGDWLAGYHLSNIFQHLLVTLLLYGFLRFLLRRTGNPHSSSDLCALLAASVFAVHPIHTEVVNSVFNRSDMMVALFGLGGLWWLLHHMDRHAAWAWFGLAVTYFLGMLSKESAVVIPGLAVAFILVLTPGILVSRIRKCLPVLWMILPLALYLILRANALFPPELANSTQVIEGAELPAMRDTVVRGDVTAPTAESTELLTMLDKVKLPGAKTVLKVSGVFAEALKVTVWPYPLHLSYATPSMPKLLGYGALNLMLLIAVFVQFRRKRYGLATGLVFFYLAMLPASRILGMGESGPHFAERYAYFPSIGLAILLAFALSTLAQRFTPRILANVAVPIVLVLAALTLDRNMDWRSEVSLFETEYQHGNRGNDTLRWVAAAYLNARNFAWVVQMCDDNLDQQEQYGDSSFVQSCATAYEQQHRYEEAERAHFYAIAHEKTRAAASMSLARFYVRHARPQDAEKQFIAAIEWSDDPADKALNTAEMIIDLNPNSREQGILARGYIEEALHLRPGWAKAEMMLQAVEKALNASRAPFPPAKG